MSHHRTFLKINLNYIESINESIADDMKPYVKQACDKGASSWLNAFPIREQNLDLNKEEFKDALRLRYNFPLKKTTKNLSLRCTI